MTLPVRRYSMRTRSKSQNDGLRTTNSAEHDQQPECHASNLDNSSQGNVNDIEPNAVESSEPRSRRRQQSASERADSKETLPVTTPERVLQPSPQAIEQLEQHASNPASTPGNSSQGDQPNDTANTNEHHGELSTAKAIAPRTRRSGGRKERTTTEDAVSTEEVADQTNVHDDGKATTKKRVSPRKAPTKKRTPLKWTLPHLLQNPKSILATATELRNNITMELINRLPQQDRDELCRLLPPADIDYIVRDTSSSTTTIVPQSLQDHERMASQPDAYTPTISPRLISPTFTRAVEDFQILLQDGYYSPQPATPSPTPRRGTARKRNHDQMAEKDTYKDDQYEAFWGERLKKKSPEKSASGEEATGYPSIP